MTLNPYFTSPVSFILTKMLLVLFNESVESANLNNDLTLNIKY